MIESTSVQAMADQMPGILSFLSAAAGLRTAAMGLLDSSKVFWGGPSNFGFGYIEAGLRDFLPTPQGAAASFGRQQILRSLKAGRLNVVAKADQKAAAKALIHLELRPDNAACLGRAAGVDGGRLASLAAKLANGTLPDAAEVSVLDQFDVVLSVVLDAAYERADQTYRNACKSLACLLPTVLAVLGGWMLYSSDFTARDLAICLFAGLIAIPLAPAAKDLATALQSAVAAIRAVRR